MRGLLLLSGGIDSPVAGYLMQRTGLEIDAIHFQNNRSSISNIPELMQVLAKDKKMILFNVPHYVSQEAFQKNCNRKFQCIYCKRMMFRVCEAVARQFNYDCLVTGENLGQVASQTLDNMFVISQSIQMPILRPLLCYEKQETIKLAKGIGTYEISNKANYKCIFLPRKPVTKANLCKVLNEEARIDVQELLSKVMQGLVVAEFGA